MDESRRPATENNLRSRKAHTNWMIKKYVGYSWLSSYNNLDFEVIRAKTFYLVSKTFAWVLRFYNHESDVRLIQRPDFLPFYNFLGYYLVP